MRYSMGLTMRDSENDLPRKLRHNAGHSKIKLAVHAHHATSKAKAIDDMRARNAYRAACGLPLIEPSNG